MSEHQHVYTEEQQEALMHRTLHDAELIQGGARYNQLGGLAITGSQYDRLHTEMRQATGEIGTDPQMEAFRGTHEYGQISIHHSALSRIRTEIGTTHLGHVAMPSTPAERRALQVGHGPGVLHAEHAYGYLHSNGIRDVNPIAAEHSDDPDAAFRTAYDRIGQRIQDLEEATALMAARPDVRIGSEVSVRRSPRHGETEGRIDDGWTIDEITASAGFRVRKYGDGHDRAPMKIVPINEVLELNAPPASERDVA